MNNEKNLLDDEMMDNKRELFYEILMKEEIKEEPLEDEIPLLEGERLDSQEEDCSPKSSTEMALQNCLQEKIKSPSSNVVEVDFPQSNSDLRLFDGKGKLKKKSQSIKKQFKCRSCPHRSSKIGALRTHERIHTGEKPSKCSSSLYRASQKGSLTTHERVHTGEKPFKCSSYPYQASQMGGLRNIKESTGVKSLSNVVTVLIKPLKWRLLRHMKESTRVKSLSHVVIVLIKPLIWELLRNMKEPTQVKSLLNLVTVHIKHPKWGLLRNMKEPTQAKRLSNVVLVPIKHPK